MPRWGARAERGGPSLLLRFQPVQHLGTLLYLAVMIPSASFFANGLSGSRDQAVARELHVGQGAIGVEQPPVQHPLGIAQQHGGHSGFTREIAHFLGIGLDIEEQRRQGGEMHIFVAPVADHRITISTWVSSAATMRRQVSR